MTAPYCLYAWVVRLTTTDGLVLHVASEQLTRRTLQFTHSTLSYRQLLLIARHVIIFSFKLTSWKDLVCWLTDWQAAFSMDGRKLILVYIIYKTHYHRNNGKHPSPSVSPNCLYLSVLCCYYILSLCHVLSVICFMFRPRASCCSCMFYLFCRNAYLLFIVTFC